MLEVVIVGAGLGGLTAAVALRKVGHDVHVIEQASAPGEVGAGIQVPPNASRILMGLGVGDGLNRVAVRPEARIARRWADGSVIFETELGAEVERRYGAPYWVVHRADLHAVLMSAATDAAAPGRAVDFTFGRVVVGVNSDADGAALVRTDVGEEWSADVVLGADGIHSKVRESLGVVDEPRFSGQLVWRSLVPTERIASPEVLDWCRGRPVTTVWLGPSQHVVHYPLRDGSLINVGAMVPGGAADESYSATGDPAAMLAAFEQWDERLVGLLRAAERVSLWPLFDRLPLAAWTAGRVGLLGDACHPMLPYQGQGAAQAVEDAAVLADVLTDVPSDAVVDALSRYAELRRPRATAVQAASASNQVSYHLPDGPEQAARDEQMRRYAGNAALPYDWLWSAAPTDPVPADVLPGAQASARRS